MKPVDPKGFEEKFRGDIDPWNYRSSPFEAWKRRVLLRACGTGTRGRGLELACAIGETTRLLSACCLRLRANDSSETAIAEARRRFGELAGVSFEQALLPAQMPRGPFDLIVASEIAYYLKPNDLGDLLVRIRGALAPGGRAVVVHHLLPFADASQLPALAHGRMKRVLGQTMRKVFDERHARFGVAAFQKLRH